ncbi:PREDICTED: uncharacterized protein LOC104612905 [Nelumbo nucifera]|uniref:Uncharacterized protein LOC104612905 n=2 Tax=Nelumbo nucifera TaxID=4432 RepID=A0A1U8BC07_NELNU|nr:PREDICTED: uncharacterized protein LOC104612905 [Nelumbo nucifera]DAD33550.1 TPA_asm: hypothetical protein HUJ06_012401 [Nelumbo nucifera]
MISLSVGQLRSSSKSSNMGENPQSVQAGGANMVQTRNFSLGSTIFEPQGEAPTPTGWQEMSGSSAGHAPEKKLILFALWLATLEKAASGVGALAFIWATVVLLGGYAIKLDTTDFWFITTILLIEGTRIFSRSRELKWQHQSTSRIEEAGIYSFRVLKSSSHFIVQITKAVFWPVTKSLPHSSHDRRVKESTDTERASNRLRRKMPTRIWATSDVPLLPYAGWVFLSRNISKLLYWLQLISATACVILSLVRLIQQDFGELNDDPDKRNQKSALNIFYGLALAEALLFLMEKAYWEWKVIYCKILEQVNDECGLGDSGMVSIKRFFYDAYSKCINGSIFDGLKMDLVSFAMELLASDSCDEQLIGARILQKFSTNQDFSKETLQKIGISISVIERLVEMLNWKDPQEEEIRRCAADILSELAQKQQNSLRVAGVPGAMESISSLLCTCRSSNGEVDEICQKNVICDQKFYDFSAFNLLGLRILKCLARDHDNCGKIGSTRGLLSKVIEFTHVEERLLRDESVPDFHVKTVKLSLQVVKMLASTTGNTGKVLRQKISEIVFTVSNIRNILQYGGKQPELQRLGIEILTSLAFEEETAERIGSTGGIIKELLHIFFEQQTPIFSKKETAKNQKHVRVAAGEALAMLALQSKSNCHQVLKLGVINKFVLALEEPVFCLHSARILKNICAHIGQEPDCLLHLKEITDSAPTVLKAIASENNKIKEVMIGLAAEIFRLMTSEEADGVFDQTNIRKSSLAQELVQILLSYKYPHIRVPQIRRFIIELAIWMIRDSEENMHIFKQLGMEEELQNVIETTSELENFNIFSGTVGLSPHNTTIHSLVDSALELLAAV